LDTSVRGATRPSLSGAEKGRGGRCGKEGRCACRRESWGAGAGAGLLVPCGPALEAGKDGRGGGGSFLYHNEYIVYDPAQVLMGCCQRYV
jgi:hypothetical protein